MEYNAILGSILAELSENAKKISADELEKFADAVISAKRVFIAGAGRSGFAARAFSNRAMHLGLTVYFVGEPTTPAIREGDILVIGSGSGTTKTMVILAEKAKKYGATLGLISGNADSIIGKMADVNIVIPRTMPKPGGKPEDRGGSFYHVMQMVCDCIQAYVLEARGMTGKDVRYYHNNLE